MRNHARASALQWVRCHQRTFARMLLALFCVAWLQAAFVPCTMAAPAMQDCEHHCPYCPTETGGTPVDHASGCAYPHEPQADARAATMFATVLAPTEVLAPAGVVPVLLGVDEPPAAEPPRLPVPLQYCRYLE